MADPSPQRHGKEPHPLQVRVTDFDMPFMSIVRFLIKWAIAAIPALLILSVLGVLASIVAKEFRPLGT